MTDASLTKLDISRASKAVNDPTVDNKLFDAFFSFNELPDIHCSFSANFLWFTAMLRDLILEFRQSYVGSIKFYPVNSSLAFQFDDIKIPNSNAWLSSHVWNQRCFKLLINVKTINEIRVIFYWAHAFAYMCKRWMNRLVFSIFGQFKFWNEFE